MAAARTLRGGGAAPDVGAQQLRRIRLRLLLGLSLILGAVMLVVGPLSGDTEMSFGLVARLLLAGVALPILAAELARRVLVPAEELRAAHGRLQAMYDQARVDALLDPITGLGNHRAFQEEFLRQLEDARRQQRSLAFALIDLDDLKRVNDERGHAGGDDLLGAMGRLVAMGSRASDRGFRIGGDEFAILMSGTDADTATAVVRRLLAAALSGEAQRPAFPPIRCPGRMGRSCCGRRTRRCTGPSGTVGPMCRPSIPNGTARPMTPDRPPSSPPPCTRSRARS